MRKTTGFLAAVAAVSAIALGGGGTPAQPFTMKLSSPVANEVSHEWMKAFKAGVEARAGGRMKVELYPANQLGQIPATVEGVAMGTIEFAVPAIGFFIGLEPRFQTLDAPGLFDSMENAEKVFQDPDIRARLATFGQDKGIEPLITFVNSPLGLLSHKAVRKVSDFQGQKIRVPGGAPMHVEPFRKLGALPVSMPLGEVMPAMQNRAVDGLIAGIAVYTTAKYYDVAKALTYLPSSFLVASGAVNRRFMASLGSDLEKIVREEAKKHEELFWTWGVEDVKRIQATWAKNGGESIVLPPAEAKAYLDLATSVIPQIVGSNPKLKEDYDALVAAAKKYR